MKLVVAAFFLGVAAYLAAARSATAAGPVEITYGYHPYWTGAWYGVILKKKELWKKYLPPSSSVKFEPHLTGPPMINNPALMILDEPFRGLDVMTRGLMQEYYLELFAESRLTTLFITSELEEAIRVGERILVMAGSPAKVMETLDVSLPYPRTPAVLASEGYLALKRRLMAALAAPLYLPEHQLDGGGA